MPPNSRAALDVLRRVAADPLEVDGARVAAACIEAAEWAAAAWRARRAGLHEHAAHAWHDLLLVCAELGAYAEAADYARRAATAYPLHARRLPYLAADLAVTLIFQRYYTPALPLLDAFVSRIEQPAEQLLAMSNQAHAAAGLGDVARFRRLTPHVLELLEAYEEHAPAALVNLAAGAYALHDWDLGERCARQAVARARGRRDREPERRARELLEAIASRTPAPGEAPVPTGASGRRLRDLIRELVARLARWTRMRAPPGAAQLRANP